MTETEKTELAKKVVAYLNSIYKADPGAVSALIFNHVPCNEKLSDHPHAVCAEPSMIGHLGEFFEIRTLGMINGLLTSLGIPKIAAATDWVDQAKDKIRLTGFCLYKSPNENLSQMID